LKEEALDRTVWRIRSEKPLGLSQGRLWSERMKSVVEEWNEGVNEHKV